MRPYPRGRSSPCRTPPGAKAALSVAGDVNRDTVLALSRFADRLLRGRPGYDAELARWTGPGGIRPDGVPTWAIGPWDALETMPVRDFAAPLPLPPPSETFEPEPMILILATGGDTAADQVCAGHMPKTDRSVQ